MRPPSPGETSVKKKFLTEENHFPRKYHTAAKAVSP